MSNKAGPPPPTSRRRCTLPLARACSCRGHAAATPSGLSGGPPSDRPLRYDHMHAYHNMHASRAHIEAAYAREAARGPHGGDHRDHACETTLRISNYICIYVYVYVYICIYIYIYICIYVYVYTHITETNNDNEVILMIL